MRTLIASYHKIDFLDLFLYHQQKAMKIRIKGNSIRLRLSRTEVANFAQNGVIEDATTFVEQSFRYRMVISTSHEELSADFDNNTITVYVPEKLSDTWTTSDMVGFENKMNLGNDRFLFLLVEKDFVCLDNTFEDQSDNYPNPNAQC